jgi:protein TonB
LAASPSSPASAAPPAPLPYDDADADDDLVPLEQPMPKPFPGMCALSCDGFVFKVSFLVLPNGEVADVRIVESSTPRLNRLVLQTVGGWRYLPRRMAQQEQVTIRMAESLRNGR